MNPAVAAAIDEYENIVASCNTFRSSPDGRWSADDLEQVAIRSWTLQVAITNDPDWAFARHAGGDLPDVCYLRNGYAYVVVPRPRNDPDAEKCMVYWKRFRVIE